MSRIEQAATVSIPAAWISFFADTLPVVQWFAGVGAGILFLLAVYDRFFKKK